METNDRHCCYSPTLWERLLKGGVAAQRRRPASFYLLLLIPLVLLLGAHLFHSPVSPRYFIVMFSLMLVFLWLVCALAVSDFMSLFRRHRAEKRAAYRETLGDPAFMEQLGCRVRSQQGHREG